MVTLPIPEEPPVETATAQKEMCVVGMRTVFPAASTFPGTTHHCPTSSM